MVSPRRAALRRHEMIYGEKQPCYTATSEPMRHYISETKSRYFGFSPLNRHSDNIIGILDPLSKFLPNYPSAWVCVCACVCVYACTYVCMSACLYVCMLVGRYMSVCVSVSLSLSRSLSLSIYLSIHLSIYLSVCLSVCVSLCLSVCLCL